MRTIKLNNNQQNSCIPSALAVVLNCKFDHINEWLKIKRYRKSNTSGTHTRFIDLNSFGLERMSMEINKSIQGFVMKTTTPLQGMSVNQFVKRHPTGTYFLLVRKHGLAVRNGIVFDTQKDSSKKRIVKAYERKLQIQPSSFTSLEPMAIAASTPKSIKLAKGDKRKKVMDVIAKGINAPADVARQVGCSYVYARSLVMEYTRMKKLQTQNI